MPLRRALRHRDFVLLFTGLAITLVGDGVYTVALAFQVYALENAPSALSLVLLCWSAGLVGSGLAAGVLLDRVDRRHAMIAADALQLIAVATMGALSLAGLLELWHCAVLAVLVGAGTAVVRPAVMTLIPMLVPREDVVAATSLHTSLNRAAFLLAGPALGGVLVAVAGPGGALLADAGTFLVSIAAVALIRSPARPVARASASPLSDLREGLGYVRARPWIWGTLLAASTTILCFLGPVEVVLPYVVKNVYGDGAAAYGLLLALGGASGLVCALVVGWRGLPPRPLTVMFATWTFSVALVAGYGVAESTAVAALFAVGYGVGTGGDVIWFVLLQTRVPSEILGRVSSLDWLVSYALLPVSFAIAGPAAEAFGARETLVGAGVLGATALVALYLVTPGLRADVAPAQAPRA